MTRPYRLGLRRQGVDRSRARILSSARAVFAGAGFHGAGLEEVALHAGVSRKTVYYQFGSKLGLLEALVTDLEGTAGIPRRVQTIMRGPTKGALRQYFAQVCQFWHRNGDIVRALEGLAATDREVRQVAERHEHARRKRLAGFVDQMAQRGELRKDYPPEMAIDLLWLLSSFSSFDHLTRRSHLSANAAAALLAEAATTVMSRGVRSRNDVSPVPPLEPGAR